MSIGITISNEKYNNHRFIQSTGKPLKNMITYAAIIVCNQLLNKQQSAKAWRKDNQKYNLSFEFPPGTKQVSKPVNYKVISTHIREDGRFDIDKLNLPHIECMWLDHSSDIKMNIHIAGKKNLFGISSGDNQAHYYGEKYPIKPTLRREGHLYTSFQPQLLDRIVRERARLINNSGSSLTDDWIFDLRNVINDSISLLDIALNQLYIKAEYEPLSSWAFDKKKLGERHGRRINDKLKWIYQISSVNIDIEKEKKNLETLRILRNHLMHFDPPSIVITLQEAANWLNYIIDIGIILIKMRRALKLEVSTELVNFILQHEAVFVPPNNAKRQPITRDFSDDYYSSTWPSK